MVSTRAATKRKRDEEVTVIRRRNQQECPISRETFTADTIIFEHCGILFDAACLKQYLVTCPCATNPVTRNSFSDADKAQINTLVPDDAPILLGDIATLQHMQNVTEQEYVTFYATVCFDYISDFYQDSTYCIPALYSLNCDELRNQLFLARRSFFEEIVQNSEHCWQDMATIVMSNFKRRHLDEPLFDFLMTEIEAAFTDILTDDFVENFQEEDDDDDEDDDDVIATDDLTQQPQQQSTTTPVTSTTPRSNNGSTDSSFVPSSNTDTSDDDDDYDSEDSYFDELDVVLTDPPPPHPPSSL